MNPIYKLKNNFGYYDDKYIYINLYDIAHVSDVEIADGLPPAYDNSYYQFKVTLKWHNGTTDTIICWFFGKKGDAEYEGNGVRESRELAKKEAEKELKKLLFNWSKLKKYEK